MLRKIICLLLSVTLIVVQSGCYSTRVISTVNAASIPAYTGKEESLDKEQWLVRVYYREVGSSKKVEGRLKTITPEYVVVTTSRDREVMIPLKQVEKMTVYDREFDEVTTVFGGGVIGVLILFVLSALTPFPALF